MLKVFSFFSFQKILKILISKILAARPKNSSPNRSLAPPIEPVKRNVSPLRNIEVPQSSLLPVKEETEISSHSDADILLKIKSESTNNNEVNNFL